MSDVSAPHLPIVDKALRVSEARYRRLFESAREGILILNAKTAQIELLGYSHAEFLGKKLWEIGAFKDTLLTMDAFAELQAKRYIRYDDLPLITKNRQPNRDPLRDTKLGKICDFQFISGFPGWNRLAH